ncbi:RUSD3 synthase, partial [Penelope pileata]|nr:RUSD3 synthase [Penelope pileata]
PGPPGQPGELTLTTLLPALRQRLGLPAELHVVKAPARECSGLVLLSGCHRTTERLQRFFTTARRRGHLPATYSAVTVGVPAEAEGEIRVGLCRQQHGDTAVVVPVPFPGRRSMARGEVKNTATRWRVLGAAGGCALLQLQPRTGCPHAPHAGKRLQFSMGGAVLPYAAPPIKCPPQVLDKELLQRLRLSPQHRLPLHLHLQQLALP